MANALIDTLGGVITPPVIRGLAARVGEPQESVAIGLRRAFAAILAGLLSRCEDPHMLRPVLDLVSRSDPSERLFEDATAIATGSLTAAPAMEGGKRLLSLALPGSANAAAEFLAVSTGFSSASAQTLMSLAAPFVLAVLSTTVRQSGSSASALATALLAEREQIIDEVPSGLSSYLGLGALAAHPSLTPAAAAVADPMAVYRAPPRIGARHPRRWPLVLAGAAGLALIWGATRRRAPLPADIAADSDITSSAAGTVDSSGALAADPPAAIAPGAAMGPAVSRQLADGHTIFVPVNGMEARLLAFVRDPSQPVNASTWYQFDRVVFAPGSPDVEPQSRDQLQSVAAILAAYPSVKVKIGGYTNDRGNTVDSRRLSQQRADNIARELSHLGVDGDRLLAEAYTTARAVGDSSTARGEVRRIALRVTAK